METLLLGIVTFIVGFLCGCTSVGGVLLIPAMDAWTGLGLHRVVGTVLFTFFFVGVLGTWLHQKAGRINWQAAIPLCAGALLTGYPGAVVKEHVPVAVLSSILGAAIILAGALSLRPASVTGTMPPSGRKNNAVLFLVGAFTSFLSCMTGAGGPIISAPLMLLLGYPPVLTVVVSQPLTAVVCLSGTLGNVSVAAIDYPIGLWTTVVMMAGLIVGVYAIRFFQPLVLKKIVTVICMATGAYMLLKNLF